MVTVGELAFSVDPRPFVTGLQRMRRELRGFAKDAREASVAFRPGGRVPGGGGRVPGIAPIPGGGGGRLPSIIPGGGLGLGGFAGIAGGVAAIAGARAAIKTAVDFESALARIGGISEETATNLDRYAQAARDAGAATRFTASESVQALEVLVRRGQNFEGASTALRPLLNFAVASDQTLPRAVESATDIATQFGIPFTEIQRVVDLVTASANRAGTTVAQMAQSFKDSGVILSEFGVSVEESAALVQILADAGIRGQKAGIALRGIAANFGTEIRSQGTEAALRSIADLPVEQLAEIFNIRQLPAAARLVRNLDDFAEKVRENTENIDGATDRVADRINRTVAGEALQLKSTFAELALQFDDLTGLTEGLASGIRTINGFLRGIAGFTSEGERLAQSFGELRGVTDELIAAKRVELRAQLIARANAVDPNNAASIANELGLFVRAAASEGFDVAIERAGQVASTALSRILFGAGEGVTDPAIGGRARTSQVSRPQGARQIAPLDEDYVNRQQVIAQLEVEAQALRFAGGQREAYNATVAAYGLQVRAIDPELQRFVDTVRQLERQDRVLDSIAQGVASLGEEALFAADNFEQAAERIVESILRISAQELALQPLADALRAGLGSIAGGFGGTARQGGGSPALGGGEGGFVRA